ncbi:MAG: 2Fe-2S iron-sulfur cluster-binding protein [Pseudomonadota bacterium]
MGCEEQEQPAHDVRIWRGRSDGAFRSYRVPARDNQTVLDVVTAVQRRDAPDLAYRFACRVGVCGSCAMMVNGVPRWTCRTHVSRLGPGPITIAPLRNLPHIKDLVTDMAPFFEKWQRAGGKFTGSASRADALASISPASKKRQQADAGIECINCAVCYAACDVVAWNEDYLGPAALLRAWTLVNDERHAGQDETRKKATGDGGCSNCHAQANCARHCPVGLSPSHGIAGLKRQSLAAMFGLGA